MLAILATLRVITNANPVHALLNLIISLQHYETTPATEPRPGDVLVVGGSPGHAVLILEVAKGADGRVWLLIGEGYMPAQSFHVELGPEDGWWLWDAVDGLRLSHWHLPGSSLRRFKG